MIRSFTETASKLSFYPSNEGGGRIGDKSHGRMGSLPGSTKGTIPE